MKTTCCVVGGGPAGIFLGYLLARDGIDVIVLEKHADFLRDFRGDTIHPSTLQLMEELGLLEDVLKIVDFRADQLWVNFEGRTLLGPVFTHLKTTCRFVGFVPQWDFLDLISGRARPLPGFDLRMSTKATDVLREGDRVVGVRCEGTSGSYEIRADLVVAADGRSSTLRSATGQPVHERGIPIDVLWFRLDRPSPKTPAGRSAGPASDEANPDEVSAEDRDARTLAWLRQGHMLVTIPRRDHYQVAMVIRKGTFPQIRALGLDRFRATVGEVCPRLATVARRMEDWDAIRLLTVQINSIERWYEPGLLFIGDAAHAMSPVGGVGINLAIQDAVATANLLAEPLRRGEVSTDDLARVQGRREPAARKTQRLQSAIHANLFRGQRSPGQPFAIPWYVRTFAWLLAPVLRRVAGRWIGLGFQPEHVSSKRDRGAEEG